MSIRGRNSWLALSVLCLGFFMVLLDTTIVNIAVPQITTSLGASLDEVLWIVDAYILAYATLLITLGRLGDLVGQKRLFLVGLVVFAAASAACGLAQSPTQLIATRALQGVGGALLTPQTLAMVTMLFPENRRGTAYGIWGGVAGLATIAGPTIGGWLVTSLGWRWIFFVNVPVGAITLVLGAWLLPDLRLNRRHRLDWQGTLLVGAGVFGVCYALIERRLYLLIPAAAVLALFVWQQRAHRDREPLVPAGIFADRNFATMCAVQAGISFGVIGLFLPLVIFLQSVLSLSALQAGLVLAPMSIASVASAPMAGRLADRDAGKELLIFGLLLWAGGIVWVLRATRLAYDRREFVTGLVIAGFGLGMTYAPLQSIAMRRIQPQMAGAAAGVMNTTRQIGSVLGLACVGALLEAQLVARLPGAARENAIALPGSLRNHFLEQFEKIDSAKGLQVGVGQSGAHLPADLPSSVRPAIEQVSERTFYDAYIPAMRFTLIVPLAVLALALVGALLARRTPAELPARTPSP